MPDADACWLKGRPVAGSLIVCPGIGGDAGRPERLAGLELSFLSELSYAKGLGTDELKRRSQLPLHRLSEVLPPAGG